MRLLRAASLAAATDEDRPMVIGEITPGNSTALRSGMRISASSGMRTHGERRRARAPGGLLAAGVAAFQQS